MVMRGSLFSFNRTGMASWSSKRWFVVELDAAGVRRISRSPSFAVISFDFFNRSSDVDE